MKGQEEFIERFKKKTGEPFLTQDALCGYGHPAILEEALEAAGAADKIKVAEAIRAMNLTTGPAAQCFPGPIKFDDKGRREDVPMIFAQWQKGVPITVFPTDLALAKPSGRHRSSLPNRSRTSTAGSPGRGAENPHPPRAARRACAGLPPAATGGFEAQEQERRRPRLLRRSCPRCCGEIGPGAGGQGLAAACRRDSRRRSPGGCSICGRRRGCCRAAWRPARRRGRSRFALASPSNSASSCKASAASWVPAQVRKSLAVMSSPLISRRYSLTSAESIVWRLPSSSRYWNSS